MKKIVYIILIFNIAALLFSFNSSYKPEVPVGTVIYSIIPPQYFLSQNSKWVLLNGEVLKRNTKLSQILLGTTLTIDSLPDARGMFIRGANSGGGLDPQSDRLVGSVQYDATRLPNSDFIGKGSAISDSLSLVDYEILSYSAPKGKPNRIKGISKAHGHKSGNKALSFYQDHATWQKDYIKSAHGHIVNVSINGGGDYETRPKNISLYTYIKIN